MAPSLPPKTEELELELDDEDAMEEGDAERMDLGGDGGSPRKISSSSYRFSSKVGLCGAEK